MEVDPFTDSVGVAVKGHVTQVGIANKGSRIDDHFSEQVAVEGGGFQLEVEQALAQLGYLPENGPLYLDMTPRELLQYLGAARQVDPGQLEAKIDAVIKKTFIEDVQAKPIGKLSKGYRQRVHLAQLLLHEPKVLIMDEPTSSLSNAEAERLFAVIGELRAATSGDIFKVPFK